MIAVGLFSEVLRRNWCQVWCCWHGQQVIWLLSSCFIYSQHAIVLHARRFLQNTNCVVVNVFGVKPKILWNKGRMECNNNRICSFYISTKSWQAEKSVFTKLKLMKRPDNLTNEWLREKRKDFFFFFFFFYEKQQKSTLHWSQQSNLKLNEIKVEWNVRILGYVSTHQISAAQRLTCCSTWISAAQRLTCCSTWISAAQ